MAPSSANVAIQGGNSFGAAPDFSAWPEPSTLVPVAINWTQGGSVVEVEGSFDNWQGPSNNRCPPRCAWAGGEGAGAEAGAGLGPGPGPGPGCVLEPLVHELSATL